MNISTLELQGLFECVLGTSTDHHPQPPRKPRSKHVFGVAGDFYEKLLKMLVGSNKPEDDYLAPIPDIFDNWGRYFRTFHGMILREACDCVRSAFSTERDSIKRVQISWIERVSGVMYSVRCETHGVSDGEDQLLIGDELVSLSSQEQGGPEFYAFTFRENVSTDGLRIVLYNSQGTEASLRKVLRAGSEWWLTVHTDMVSHLREYRALCGCTNTLDNAIRRSILLKTPPPPIVLLGDDNSAYDEDGLYNQKQVHAIRAALHESSSPITLLQGPPGTGKTRTVLGVITALLARGERVLVCAPSNTATDEIVSRLLPQLDDTKKMVHLIKGPGDKRADLAKNMDLVVCTLSMAGSPTMQRWGHMFPTVVVDEACQCVEPSVLIALSYGCKRLIMVGDPYQLPPTVLSKATMEAGYNRSAFQRLVQAGYPLIRLTKQYRMHPAIRSFPSHYFYEDTLEDDTSLVDRVISHHKKWYFGPMLFYDTQTGCEARSGTSVYNIQEARFVVDILKQFRKEFPAKVHHSKIAVITPYRAQIATIETLLLGLWGGEWPNMVRLNTVDAFQGCETDVVIFSSVRSSSESRRGDGYPIGFLADARRMNVAITRSRQSVWVVGHGKCLAQSPHWNALIEDCVQRHILVKTQGRIFQQLPGVGVGLNCS